MVQTLSYDCRRCEQSLKWKNAVYAGDKITGNEQTVPVAVTVHRLGEMNSANHIRYCPSATFA